MKHLSQLFLIIAICFLGIGCSMQHNSHRNISKLDDFWSFYSSDPSVKMQDVWRIADDVLICTGSPQGYIYSNSQFDNFVLKLEWRWPADKQPGKGGVLVRMTGENKIWPKSLEAQLNAGDAGDFWGLDGYELSGPADRTVSLDHDTFGKLTNVKKTEKLERSPGQWNTYEIIARADAVTLIVNGKQINRATECNPGKGRICLTSEGSEIHFRNIEIKPLSAAY